MKTKWFIGGLVFLLATFIVGWRTGLSNPLPERRPEPPPLPTLNDIVDSFYFQELDHYITGHFPYRNDLIRLKSWVDYALFRTASTRTVHVGTDGWLYLRGALTDVAACDRATMARTTAQMRSLARRLHEVETVLETSGRTFVLLIAPVKARIYPEYIGRPPLTMNCAARPYEALLEALKDDPLKHLVLIDRELSQRKATAQMYYKTDTHLNPDGGEAMAESLLRELDPTGWANRLPKSRPAGLQQYSGDLSRMLAVKVVESAKAAGGLTYTADITVEQRAPLENGNPRYSITARSRTAAPLLPRAILYRDSFMQPQYVMGAFSHLDVVWTNELLLPEVVDDLRGAKIVIYEVVERSLPNLKIDAKALAAVLHPPDRTTREGDPKRRQASSYPQTHGTS